ncbi:MAG: hypothetical protein LC792_27270 [Actinobacteria bacterium]|nr:hypothetical protein [Actinomycetota bacterium]
MSTIVTRPLSAAEAADGDAIAANPAINPSTAINGHFGLCTSCIMRRRDEMPRSAAFGHSCVDTPEMVLQSQTGAYRARVIGK